MENNNEKNSAAKSAVFRIFDNISFETLFTLLCSLLYIVLFSPLIIWGAFNPDKNLWDSPLFPSFSSFLATGIIVAIATYAPFMVAAVWLHKVSFIEALTKKSSIKVLGIFLVFMYGLQSHYWSEQVINRMYSLDPASFKLTSTILSFFYGPFTFIIEPLFQYREIALKLADFLMAVFSIVLAINLSIRKFRYLWKASACALIYSVAFNLLIAFSVSAALFSSIGIEFLVLEFDQKQHHSCNNPLFTYSKVVFLTDNMVYSLHGTEEMKTKAFFNNFFILLEDEARSDTIIYRRVMPWILGKCILDEPQSELQ